MRGAPGQCHTWMRHEGVSAVSHGGILLHAPAGRDPPGSATAGTPGVPTACRGALRRGLCGCGYPTYPRAAPDIAKNPQSPQITPSRPSRQASHTVGRPSNTGLPLSTKFMKTRKVRRPYSIVPFLAFMRFLFHIQPGGLPYVFAASPCDSTASHTQAAFPYVFAASPCSHTLSTSPHMPQRLPTGRPFPIRFPRIRHTVRKLSKFDFDLDETSDRPRK